MTEDKVVHAGYLLHRPGGALGRWKKKRYWFQLDEVTCQLRLYKSQAELCHTLGVVDIRDACISILPDHTNHILVACGGKEHILIAETHRAMMQWLQNLQEVRDFFSCVKSHRSQVKFSKTSTYKPTTQSSPTKGLASSPLPSLRRHHSEKFRARSKNVSELPASFSASLDNTDGYASIRKSLSETLSLPNSKTNFVADSTETSPTSLRSCNSIASQSSTEEIAPSARWSNGATGGITDASDQSEVGVEHGNGLDAKGEVFTADEDDEVEQWKLLSKEELIQELQKRRLHIKEKEKNYKSLENREQTYKQMLKKRDQVIMHLDDKLGIMEQANHMRRDLLSPEDMDAAQQKINDLQGTCKIYQEQNGFLNTEVRRQASLRRREKSRIGIQHKLMEDLENNLLQSRQDYFQLLTQLVEVTSLDLKDNISLEISWEDAQYKRFLVLYNSAKKQDPLLPDPRVIMTEGHTDIYGFQHPINNQPLLFHHLCQILLDHLMAASRKSTEHRKQWDDHVNSNEDVFLCKQDELRDLVYNGIPTDKRSDVWKTLVMQRVKSIKEEKSEDYFQWLCNRTGTSASVDKYRRQIELDLLRTMPHNIHFNSKDTEGVKQLRQILEAFCVHNPTVGYCQGMNFIAGTCLLFMDVETAFWCMVAVVESYFPANYFDSSLIGAQADQNILKDILELRLPDLHSHLNDVGIEMCSFTLNWFLAIYFEVVPFTMLLRIWDCFLFDGLRVLFQFAIALLEYHEASLLKKKDILAILKDTKSMAKLTQDVEAIVSIVKESNDNFPSAAWIQERQHHYMGILRVVFEQQEKSREEFERQEGLAPHPALSFDDKGCMSDLKMDCAIECFQGNLLICRGELRQGWIGRVDVGKCIKQNSGVRLDNRIVCVTMAGVDMALLGTISNFLYAFSVGTLEELWFERLRDTPLSIVHDPLTRNVYIGLADGTLAVIEGASHASPRDVFYQAIGATAVRSVLYLPQVEQIWCACGNSINIVNNSLNIVDGFEISKDPDIHVSGMYLGDQGVWITVRGSSLLMLWDYVQVQCVMVHDTSADQTPIVKQPQDSHNQSKIISLLPYKDSLWVGTASGYLTIYQIAKAQTVASQQGCKLVNGEHHPTEDSEVESDEKQVIKEESGGDVDVAEMNDSETNDLGVKAADMNDAGQNDAETQDGRTQSETKGTEALDTETKEEEIKDAQRKDEDTTDLETRDGEKNAETKCAEIVIPETDAGEAEDSDKSSPHILKEFFVVESCDGLPESPAGSDSDMRYKSHLPHLAKVHSASGLVVSSDDENKPSPISRARKGRKGSRKGRNSPKHLRKIWQTRQKSPEKQDEELSPRSSKALEKVQSMFGKLTLGNGQKARKYRYSQEMREETRRGSRIFINDAVESTNVSAMSLMSLVDAESHMLRPTSSVLSRDSIGDLYTSRPRPPLFDASEVDVQAGYELCIEAKRKISDHQVRCLVLTSLEEGEPAIVSCAGFYGDDESILRWTCHTRENVWMQLPIEDTTI
ncbi:TBC1 domain family member 2A-like [Asterias rubens]|uniref:TBC1 domain family member 2A-like n=1 Tax=Asterias rubens TaxID=7604 RepID=UPI001454FD59|nr:TBC1 domain family member 2A-like [Asterias rubens]XP_033643166.1 TBC1 domain family member 2A-like [Asterias rubens]XP_033643167.1 TBC1 domain family member 2A-like [Asterias rubens]